MTDQETNEAVARELGWTQTPDCKRKMLKPWTRPEGKEDLLPDYCHSIEAAWAIVEQEHKDGYFRMHDDYEYTPNGKKLVYRCIFGVHNSTGFAESTDETAPMAICIAFLKSRKK